MHCRQINIPDERPLNIINLADPVTVRSLLAAIFTDTNVYSYLCC
jgi:hypothetical protein